ncbi:hypothetical protein DFW101_0517 [Solidesulfovibrio carbinoliphilus subsp. oakridgensis]|uniref:HicA protein n=1 Tax=Solidesulfovibrio carbinoliphilus subsp. oakridgensis TaxID=694327 RepID=G7QDM8_9BACT|nr:hypothetical protein [Solidesulfovibrio carbinoliphilus]EHJ46534.1 hypothetical protein DFW101_0517 [Solidesulfovibrio carbinoliphilus subsp. oakridgensis]
MATPDPSLPLQPAVRLNSARLRTWQALFVSPSRSDILWSDVKALIHALGGQEIHHHQKTTGSRVRFLLGGVKGFFHRPHPGTVLHKGCVADVREFLIRAKAAA